MLKLGFSILVCYVFVKVSSKSDMGSGIWRVLNIKQHEEQNHKVKFDVEQRKVNRTHDGFSGQVSLKDGFTEIYGIHIDICKYVDGGCKQYQILSDVSAINFINKYAKNNKKVLLENAGVDPADFPVEKGTYKFKNYLFNYEELPEHGIYGEFGAVACLLHGAVEVGCMEVQLEFKEAEDHEDCDDDDD